jgi:hypothetical protein
MDMPRISPTDLGAIERTPTSPAALTHGLWEVLSNSVAAKVKVDSVNRETGEYRIVMHGTLDLSESKFENP